MLRRRVPVLVRLGLSLLAVVIVASWLRFDMPSWRPQEGLGGTKDTVAAPPTRVNGFAVLPDSFGRWRNASISIRLIDLQPQDPTQVLIASATQGLVDVQSMVPWTLDVPTNRRLVGADLLLVVALSAEGLTRYVGTAQPPSLEASSIGPVAASVPAPITLKLAPAAGS